MQIKHDQISSPNIPSALKPSLELLTRLSTSLRTANVNLLHAVTPAEANERFASAHDPSKPSDTALDLIYAPQKPLARDAPDNTHTDGGSMTILCSDSWGIKLEDPRTKQWGFVEPRPGTGLVNVADWLDKASKGGDGSADAAEQGRGVHSCRHAVSQPRDGEGGRYYVVSYLRPSHEVLGKA